MTALIYTYPPDYVMAATAARVIKLLGVKPVLLIDQKDPTLVVRGVDVVRTKFDRQKNLNGKEFVIQNFTLMEELATGDMTIKCDSDTLVVSLRFLAGHKDKTAVGVWHHQLQGCCYALRVADLSEMRAHAERSLQPSYRHMEDQVTGEIAMKVGATQFPVQHSEPTGYRSWRPGRDRAWCLENGVSVLNFPLRTGVDRRHIAQAMQSFL